MKSRNLYPRTKNIEEKIKGFVCKRAGLLLCILALSMPAFSQPYTAVALTGYNADVISNGTVPAASSLSLPAGYSNGFDNAGWALLSQDYNYAGNTPMSGAYLPTGGLLNSSTIAGLTYQLASYSSNNSLWLPVTTSSGTLTFVTPQAAATVYVLGTSGSGVSNFNITVNFSDGSTQSFTGLSYGDWFGASGEYTNIGRVSVSGNNTVNANPDPMLYNDPLVISAANATKLITGITVTRVAGGAGCAGVFAVSMSIPPAYSASVSSLSAFTAQACSNSASQNFVIKGVNLNPAAGSVVATAPAGFQVSTDGTTWGATASFAYTAANLSATVYARFQPSAVGAATPGNITFTSGTVPPVAVSGTGTALTAITGTNSLCPGANVPLANATSGGTWSSSNTAFATVSPSGVVFGVAPGAVNIIYTIPCGVNTSMPVTILNQPAPLSVTNVCAGSTCTLNDVVTGGSWASSNTAIATIGLLSGVVSGVNAGPSLITYTLISTGCSMTAPITVYALPNLYNVTQAGGSNYCAGAASPIQIGLSGSAFGLNYQLLNNGLLAGASVPGTNAPITFGFEGPGFFKVVASNPATGCLDTMTGNGLITTTPAPIVDTVSGTGSFCAGSGGSVHEMLNNSTIGIHYQLYNGGVPAGSMVIGTGSSFDFGAFSAAGTYTAVATDPSTGCTANMSGSGAITINPLPVPFAVTGGGGFCAGAQGDHVGLLFSTIGINYSLFEGGVYVDSVHGTSGALDFGLFTSNGNYTVVADNPITHCTSNMTGSVSVATNFPPATFTVTGGGNYCAGGTGVPVGLSGSQTTAFYQVYNGTTPFGGPLTGVGTAFNFPALNTAPGTYTIVGTSIANGCKDTMIGNVTIGTTPLPTIYAVSGGGSYCAGGSGEPVLLSNTDTGVNYLLFYGIVSLGDTIAGVGGPEGFGNVTTAGMYKVIASNATTGCTIAMSGSAAVTISPLPDIHDITGTGSYCSNDGGKLVGLNTSDLGITYILSNDGGVVDSVSGTGVAVNFGLQPGPATYTAIAVNSATRCSSNMFGNATINVIPSPSAHNVTGGGGICAGSATGKHIGLDASDDGVSYQLMKAGLPVGPALTGVAASAIDFGVFTTTGTYTVVGTASGCSTTMIGNAVITNQPAPTVFLLSGGGNYCPGGTGVDMILNGSATGVSYQLYDAGSPEGVPVMGTGTPFDFGLQTDGGSYTAIATDASGCSSAMAGNPGVIILPVPAAHNVTGGGNYCAGGSGEVVGLDGSDAGIHYQLSFDGSPIGGPLAGTGAALDFGTFTAQGSYGVTAVNDVTGCSVLMPAPVGIFINLLPVLETVTGGGTYCLGGTGVAVSMSPSAEGVFYRLYRNGVATSAPAIEGIGTTLGFGLQTLAGTYTVVATNTGGCTATMTGSALIAISAPTVYTVSGSGTYCLGSPESDITLSGSGSDITYQLYNSGAPAGIPVTGSGLALDLGSPTGAGTYTVIGTSVTSGCVANMAGSATVVINSLPATHSVTGGGPYCSGGAGLHIGVNGSDAGISYQLYNSGGLPAGGSIAGTGSAIDFGLIAAAGTYTVKATNPATGCSGVMLSSATITIQPSPVVYPVSVDNFGNYCSGNPGVDIHLDMATVGVNYSLYRGPILVFGPVSGTVPLDFGLQTVPGTYLVSATYPVSGCSSNMSGNPVITEVPSPAVHTLNGGGSYCPADPGRDVLLDGSNAGVSYQLYNSGTPVGSPLTGTGIVVDFGNQVAGNYKAIGVNTTTILGHTISCPATMADTAVAVTLSPLLTPVVTITAYPAGAKVSRIDSVKVTVSNGGPLPTYQWVLNGNIIPGATQSSYTAFQFFNGDSIACIVTSSGPCGGLSASNHLILSLSVGVTQVTAAGNDIRLAPNPNKGVFTLKGTLALPIAIGTDEELTMEVTNMLGQVVYTNKVMAHNGSIDERIDLGGSLANGMYIMALRSGTQNNTIHFVIEQ